MMLKLKKLPGVFPCQEVFWLTVNFNSSLSNLVGTCAGAARGGGQCKGAG